MTNRNGNWILCGTIWCIFLIMAHGWRQLQNETFICKNKLIMIFLFLFLSYPLGQCLVHFPLYCTWGTDSDSLYQHPCLARCLTPLCKDRLLFLCLWDHKYTSTRKHTQCIYSSQWMIPVHNYLSSGFLLSIIAFPSVVAHMSACFIRKAISRGVIFYQSSICFNSI